MHEKVDEKKRLDSALPSRAFLRANLKLTFFSRSTDKPTMNNVHILLTEQDSCSPERIFPLAPLPSRAVAMQQLLQHWPLLVVISLWQSLRPAFGFAVLRGAHDSWSAEVQPSNNACQRAPPLRNHLSPMRAIPTELPDSLEDAAIRAAEASAAYVELTGPLARCRIDFDTNVGDETFSLLKTSTEFMQVLVTALATAIVPGVEERRMQENLRLSQARAELKEVEQELQAFQQSGEGIADSNSGSVEDARMRQLHDREDTLVQLIQRQGRRLPTDNDYEPWTGPTVRVYFPDEGNAALARRDWVDRVPECVKFASCGGVQLDKDSIASDVLVFFFCPRASESDDVEQLLQRHELESPDLKLSVFVNPNLVDMGVTGFGLAGRLLRERLIDPLQYTYYMRTLQWGALTRQWPNLYSVWQEDEAANGGYRLLQTLERLPSNPEVEDIYDRENSRSGEGGGGPGVLNQLGDFINGMMRL